MIRAAEIPATSVGRQACGLQTLPGVTPVTRLTLRRKGHDTGDRPAAPEHLDLLAPLHLCKHGGKVMLDMADTV